MVTAICVDVGYFHYGISLFKEWLVTHLCKWHLEPSSAQKSVSALFSSFRWDPEPVGCSAATSVTTLSLPCATLSVTLS